MFDVIISPVNDTCIETRSKTSCLHNVYVQKERIISDLYITGRINGLYFGKSSKNTINPVKQYIENCLYKTRINFDADLVDDCYNEGFAHLQKIEPLKFMEMFYESPSKVIATLLTIIRLKCFAVDPRHGNPKHSLVQGILFASSYCGSAQIRSGDEYDIDDHFEEQAGRQDADNFHAPITQDDEPDGFETQYGFTIEDILDRLTKRERKTFYEMIDKKQRGRLSADKIRSRTTLCVKLMALRKELNK